MTYKISILTPVHISSGNKNACFLYHPDKNDHFNCYRIEDLLQNYNQIMLVIMVKKILSSYLIIM